MIGGFLFGAIAGGAAIWLYGDQIRSYIDQKSRAVRAKAADGLMTAAETIEGGGVGGATAGQGGSNEPSRPGIRSA